MIDTSNFPHLEDIESYITSFAKAGIAISSIEIRPFALRINVRDPSAEQAPETSESQPSMTSA